MTDDPKRLFINYGRANKRYRGGAHQAGTCETLETEREDEKDVKYLKRKKKK